MKLLKILGILGALGLVGIFAYQLFGLGGNANGSLLEAVPREEVTRQRVVSSLARLQAISFGTSVLSDPVFASLIENSRPLTPQPVGRTNPFVEIGADAPFTGSSDILTPFNETEDELFESGIEPQTFETPVEEVQDSTVQSGDEIPVEPVF